MQRSMIVFLGLFCLILVGCKKESGKSPGKDPGVEDKEDSEDEDEAKDNDKDKDKVTRKRTQSVAQENTKANLLAVFTRLQAAITSSDTRAAAGITQSFFPDRARLGKALRDDAPAELTTKLLAMYERFGKAPREKLARLLRARPGQTEIQIPGATTEEIAANDRDSIVWREFPGGAVQLAKKVLRPGVTFYEIETLEPGKKRGMKYHLFFWDGSQWTMLGPAWRAARTKTR